MIVPPHIVPPPNRVLAVIVLIAFTVLFGRILDAEEASNRLASRDTSLNLFLYVEEDLVRLEALVPLHVLEVFFPVSRDNPDVLSIQEQERSRDDIAALISAHANLRIDGVKVLPESELVFFFDRDVMDLAKERRSEPVLAGSCLVGIVLQYPTLAPPRQVDVQWALHHPAVPLSRLSTFAYGEAGQGILSPGSTRYTWRSHSEVIPTVVRPLEVDNTQRRSSSPGAGLTEHQAHEITELLLRNVYRAFHYRREESIYDGLAQSLAGPLLTEVYLSLRRGLENEAEGGAIVRIDRVELNRLEPDRLDADSFTSRVGWTVAGRIEHWGHVHTRENYYEAVIEARVKSGEWRIHELNFAGMRRISANVAERVIPEAPSREGSEIRDED